MKRSQVQSTKKENEGMEWKRSRMLASLWQKMDHHLFQDLANCSFSSLKRYNVCARVNERKRIQQFEH